MKQLYKAEDLYVRMNGPTGRTFNTLEEIDTYVNKIIRSRWWDRRCTVTRVNQVRFPRKGYENGSYANKWYYEPKLAIQTGPHNWSCYEGYMYIKKPDHYFEFVILHELAHIMTRPDVEPHGPEFMYCFKELLIRQLGKEAWKLLKLWLNINHVQWRLPRGKYEVVKRS